MDSSEKEKISSAYTGKILGIRLYNSDKQEFDVSDFKDLEVLDGFLGEVSTGESDITPAGKSFLERYYGFEELASILFKVDQPALASEIPAETEGEITEWFKHIEPMAVLTFIEKARGNIDENSTLNEHLLPPEEYR